MFLQVANGVYIRYKPMSEHARMPTKATPNSAGYDLYLPEDIELKPGERDKVIPLDFTLSFPSDYHGVIRPRSSSAVKYHLNIFPGLIDPDYDGVISLVVSNPQHFAQHFARGCRIAQIVFYPTVAQHYCDVSKMILPAELSPTPTQKPSEEKVDCDSSFDFGKPRMQPIAASFAAAPASDTSHKGWSFAARAASDTSHKGFGSTGH